MKSRRHGHLQCIMPWCSVCAGHSPFATRLRWCHICLNASTWNEDVRELKSTSALSLSVCVYPLLLCILQWCVQVPHVGWLIAQRAGRFLLLPSQCPAGVAEYRWSSILHSLYKALPSNDLLLLLQPGHYKQLLWVEFIINAFSVYLRYAWVYLVPHSNRTHWRTKNSFKRAVKII